MMGGAPCRSFWVERVVDLRFFFFYFFCFDVDK
jgi:hypothetical protein